MRGPDGCGGVCGTCEEGEETCTNGQCLPKVECSFVPADSQVGKVASLVFGNGGMPGEALDIDGDPETCAPADNCQGGLDNQLVALLPSLASLLDPQAELDKGLADGSILLLVELVQPKTDNSPFTLNFYFGQPKESKETCDFQASSCDYYVTNSSLDPVTCGPITSFPDATLTNGTLVAGGVGQEFTFTIPVQEGVSISLSALRVQVRAEATLNPVQLTNGLLGGAVRKDAILEALDMLPPEFWADLPVSPELVKSMADSLIEPDLDLDEDGEPDSISIAIKFTAHGGTIIGLEPSTDQQ